MNDSEKKAFEAWATDTEAFLGSDVNEAAAKGPASLIELGAREGFLAGAAWSRPQALEEAAKVIEAKADHWKDKPGEFARGALGVLINSAMDVRALKDQK